MLQVSSNCAWASFLRTRIMTMLHYMVELLNASITGRVTSDLTEN